jgi:DNA mismatch repair protein MutL
MDPELVDVNVHPAKREVRFHRPGELRALIVEQVTEALRETAPVVVPEAIEEVVEVDPALMVPADAVPAPATSPARVPVPQAWTVDQQHELPVTGSGDAVAGGEKGRERPRLRVVGVLGKSYVLLEASDGLVLMDPVAARSRVLFDGMLRKAEGEALAQQGLLVPILVELEPRDHEVVMANRDNFLSAGLEVEAFGGQTIQVASVPALLAERDPKRLLLDLVDELVASEGGRRGRAQAFEVFAERVARLGARGEPCRSESAKGLLDELFACSLPYCAPNGRPTLVQLSFSELDRKFGKNP